MAPYFKISIIFLESLLSQGHYSYINIIFVSSFELRMPKSEHLYACPNLKKKILGMPKSGDHHINVYLGSHVKWFI